MINSQMILLTKHIKYLKEQLGQFLQPLWFQRQANGGAGKKVLNNIKKMGTCTYGKTHLNIKCAGWNMQQG